MRIHFRQGGGIAAAPSPLEIDTERLTADEARAWTDLVERTNFFSQPAQSPSAPGADRMQSEVSIEDGTQSHAVRLLEGAVPAALQPLLRRLQQAAREALAARVAQRH